MTLADRTRPYAGFGFGSMAGYAAGYPLLGRGYLGYIVFGNADWTGADFDLERDYPALVAVLEQRYRFSAEREGLARFLRAGKKMMVWHGSNDVITSHKDTARAWQQVVLLRPADRRTTTRGCTSPPASTTVRAAPAPAIFDLYTPMMNWVEMGVAPGEISAAKLDPATGQPQLTRPLCVHPAVPRCRGPGRR